jgi:hypothetical protein
MMAHLVKSKTPDSDNLRGLLLENLSYDEFTGVFIRKSNPNSKSKIGDVAGYITSNGYIFIGVGGKQYLAHRLAILYCYGYMPKCVDHINGNRLDNRIINLRPCERRQNCYNMMMKKSNKSGVKGVCWSRQKSKWEARIRANGIRHHIGFFSKISDAESAIKEKRILLHGEFANNGEHKSSDIISI